MLLYHATTATQFKYKKKIILFISECIRQLLRTYLPETKSRYQLQRSDYTNHLTMVVNRPSSTLEKGRLQALKKSKKSIGK